MNSGLNLISNLTSFPKKISSPATPPFDLIATAKNSLQGELRWELEWAAWAALIMSGGVRQLPSVRDPPDTLPTAPGNPPDPDPAACGKYPPGEGSPSGPNPGLKLSTKAGGLHRCKNRKNV